MYVLFESLYLLMAKDQTGCEVKMSWEGTTRFGNLHDNIGHIGKMYHFFKNFLLYSWHEPFYEPFRQVQVYGFDTQGTIKACSLVPPPHFLKLKVFLKIQFKRKKP